MPAKPRPRLVERLVEEVRLARLAAAGFRDRVIEPFDRDFVDRGVLELDRFDFLALCLMCWC
jgi:hypothetical protein